MATIKSTYPSTSTVSVTCSLASLASGASGVFTAGRESAFIDNTANRDLDHILAGKIRVGASGLTAGRNINIYAFIPRSISSGTGTWPDQMTGADVARNVTSANVMASMTRLVASTAIDVTGSRDYDFSGVSVSSLFGSMPMMYGLYVAHDTGAALSSTGGDHVITFERIQGDVT